MQKQIQLVFSCLIFFIFSACQNSDKHEDTRTDDSPAIAEQVMQEKFNAQNVFNTLPTRALIVKLIDENKLEYNSDYVSNPTSVNKYNLEVFKSVNLGIYGADLCVASSFKQTQESMVFLKSVNILANALGVSGAFNSKMFERIENNNNNNDSIIEIVTNAFKQVDEILKQNKRPATAAIILAGSWIEGFYVSTQIAIKGNNPELNRIIISHKESLMHLIILLQNVSLEENTKFILEELNSLLRSISEVENLAKYDNKSFETVFQKIASLRNKCVAIG